MIRLSLRPWLAKFTRRRALLLAFLLLLGASAATGPRLWAWHQLRQGRSELEHSNLEEARRHLSACLRFWPQNVTAHLLASRTSRLLEDYDEAEEHLRQAQREQRQFSDQVMREWALHRATMGDLQRTELYLLPLTQEESKEAFLAYEALAQGYQRNYLIAQSLFLLDQWLKRRPNDVRPLLVRGRLWMRVYNCQRAMLDYRRALELDRECDEAQRGLAVGLTETSHWNEAVRYWEELHRRYPTDPEVRVNLARCWGQLEHARQAQETLQEVLEEHPDHLLALRSLGQIYLQQQQPTAAETWLRRAIRAAPEDYKSHWLLYQALKQQDKTAEAERHLEQAEQVELRWQRLSKITQQEMAARPHDAVLQTELGVLLLDLGYKEAGRNWLLAALQEDPNCARARAALEGSNRNEVSRGRLTR